MEVKPFIITGCGRSGTTFVWHLLNRLGIRTSHEEFFRAEPRDFYKEWLAATGTKGEVSGLAPPLLDHRIHPSTTFIHLTRNPVAVIASLMGLQSFHAKHHQNLLIKHNFRHVPAMDMTDHPLISCMKYWLHWNRLVPVVPVTVTQVRAENLLDGDGAWRLVCELTDDASAPITEVACRETVEGLGRLVNSSPRDPAVSWRRLPEADGLKDEIAEQAAVYGYTLEDLDGYCPLGAGCPHCAPDPLGPK